MLRHTLGKEVDDPIVACIDHFNRVSRWVTTLVLAHPKAKHRARVYERLQLITIHLRLLNNYESLYALISGMSDSSITRMTSTLGLVQRSEVIEREWDVMRELVSPRGGYAAYRKAIALDMAQDRPAIPIMCVIANATPAALILGPLL